MICVSSEEYVVIHAILKEHILKGVVMLFGSRHRGTNRKFSDLDIAVDMGRPLSFAELSAIQNDFEESDLPFRVDVLDYWAVSTQFRAIIEAENEILYTSETEIMRNIIK